VQDAKIGKPQPPSVSSDVSSEPDAQADTMLKALAFVGEDSDVESDSQAKNDKAGVAI